MTLSLLGFTAMALLVKHLGVEREVSPWWALLFRALIGLGVVVMIFMPSGNVDLRRSLLAPKLAMRGLLGAVSTGFYYLTLPALGAGKATLIGNTWVIWATLLAALILGETLTWRKTLGMLLAIFGILLLMGLQAGDFTHLGPYDAIAIIGAWCSGIVVVIIRQLTRQHSSGTIFASQCYYSAFLAIPFLIQTQLPDGKSIFLLTLAAVAAAVGQLSMTEGFRYLTVTLGSAMQVLMPVLVTFSSILIFGETFASHQWIGAVLILTGCYQTINTRARG